MRACVLTAVLVTTGVNPAVIIGLGGVAWRVDIPEVTGTCVNVWW